jgi:hypothetical protein
VAERAGGHRAAALDGPAAIGQHDDQRRQGERHEERADQRQQVDGDDDEQVGHGHCRQQRRVGPE